MEGNLGSACISDRTFHDHGWNADHKFVAYPIGPVSEESGRCLVNWIAELNLGDRAQLPRRDWNRRGEKAAFAGEFEGWKFPFMDVPLMIKAASEVFEFPMVDRDPVSQWSFGRVTLLGDAAHPMYPIGSNGASQAILDAEALADAVLTFPDPVNALNHYQESCMDSTTQIVESNRKLGPEVVSNCGRTGARRLHKSR